MSHSVVQQRSGLRFKKRIEICKSNNKKTNCVADKRCNKKKKTYLPQTRWLIVVFCHIMPFLCANVPVCCDEYITPCCCAHPLLRIENTAVSIISFYRQTFVVLGVFRRFLTKSEPGTTFKMLCEFLRFLTLLLNIKNKFEYFKKIRESKICNLFSLI